MSTRRYAPFAEHLRHYRLLAGLTQEGLAERAQMSGRGISDLERGINRRPRRETVRLLADALGLDGEARELFEAAARESSLPDLLLTGMSDVGGAELSRLIGRGKEVAAMDAHLRGNSRRVLVVAGEPGIGKTRLLHESSRLAQKFGAESLHGGCQRRSVAEPFAPLPQALLAWLERQRRSRLRSLLTDLPWLVRLLPELTSLLPVSAATPETPEHQERRLVFRDVARLLARGAGYGSLLLVLDDLQWAGADLFDLLSAILLGAPAVRLVAAYRDTEVPSAHPLAGWLDDVARTGELTRIALEPFSDEDAAALLNVILPLETEERAALEERIVRRASGVPFFLVSYVEGLRRGTVDSRSDVPWDLAQSIRQRVASLPERGQVAIQAASIVGRSVSLPLVAAALDLPESEALTSLDLAYDAGLLVEDGEAQYRFRHDVVRDVVEADLGAGRKAILHARVGAALEHRQPGAVDLLAHHWSRTTDLVKAARYLELAGDRAWEQFAHSGAAELFSDAVERLDALGEAHRSAGVRMKFSLALAVAGGYSSALASLEPAIHTYHLERDEDGEAHAGALLGSIYFAAGAPQEGLARVEEILSRLDNSHATPGLAALWREIASLRWNLGQYDRQLQAAERSAEIARAAGQEDLAERADRHRRTALRFLGQRAESEEVPAGADVAQVHQADLMVGQFDLREHRARMERALHANRTRGDVFAEILSQQLLGYILIVLGEWSLGRRHLEEALENVRRMEITTMAPGPRMDLGWLCLLEGDWEAAASWLNEALSLASHDLFAQRVILGRLAVLDVLEHRPEAAIERLTPVLDRPGLEEAQVTSLLPTLAWAHLEAGDHARAETCVNDAIRRATANRDRIDLAHALLVHGRLLAEQNLLDEALDAFENTIGMARALPHPFVEATALREASCVHAAAGRDEQARARFDAALGIYRRLGARREIERCTACLEELTKKHLHSSRELVPPAHTE